MTPGPVREIELLRVRLPLARPFATAGGTTTTKDALLVHVVTDDGHGWGECGAQVEPTYAPETIDTAYVVLRDHLAPRVLAGRTVDDVRGNPFAKAALGTAVLDAHLRAAGVSLAAHLGGARPRIVAGVAIGMADEADLRASAASYVAQGYRRLKLKIAPGHDVALTRSVRAEVGDAIALAVDANGSYSFEQAIELAALDGLGLQCIEQPLAPDALLDHALLAAGLATPVCLDESITSADTAASAIALGATDIVNVKPGRVGGIDETRRLHDLCYEAAVPMLVGGMLETGIGRAVNIAVASLPGFTEPGDCSASDRYFAEDLTEPFVLEDGCLVVPTGPGIGVEPRPAMLRAHMIERERIRPAS
jgi:o-succinylbenzoate synthase